MNIYARQGDLVIDRLATPITGELEKGRAISFAGDSSGHPHRLLGACEFRREANGVTLVRVAKPTKIAHGKAGGHKAVTLEAGDYEVRRLRERGDKTDRIVED
jgi:hypothetical protein